MEPFEDACLLVGYKECTKIEYCEAVQMNIPKTMSISQKQYQYTQNNIKDQCNFTNISAWMTGNFSNPRCNQVDIGKINIENVNTTQT